jgi:hypothetical protein
MLETPKVMTPDGAQLRSLPMMRKRWFQYDLVTVDEFIRLYGREAYRNAPRSAVIKDGKRKMFTRQYCMELGSGHG